MNSGSIILSQEAHWIKLLDPVADAFDSTVTTTPYKMGNAHGASFLITKGVGATGTSTITVEACDDTSATNTSALVFKYRICTTTDVWGALVQATTAGFTTTAGSSQRYWIHVNADQLGNSGYKYIRLKAVEVVNSPVLGGIDLILWPLRYDRAITATQA